MMMQYIVYVYINQPVQLTVSAICCFLSLQASLTHLPIFVDLVIEKKLQMII